MSAIGEKTKEKQSKLTEIRKRDGRAAPFDEAKIAAAIEKAFLATLKNPMPDTAAALASAVSEKLCSEGNPTPDVEHVQDVVENTLIDGGFVTTAKAYILYRNERQKNRDLKSRLMRTFEEITYAGAKGSDVLRENANVDGDTAMGVMLKYGSEAAKEFYHKRVLSDKHSRAHREGDIHIHDLDFLTLTTTCTQIDILKLFEGGFSTGHGTLREPNDIQSYAALACIAVQSNQNDQHGGQSIVNFDYGMADGVRKTFVRLYRSNVAKMLMLMKGTPDPADELKQLIADIDAKTGLHPKLSDSSEYLAQEAPILAEKYSLTAEEVQKVQQTAHHHAEKETNRACFQAMEAFIHNLNTMHSRAGAQTPFSSINYGMDTSPEGRMVVKNLLETTLEGLGHGETPIFPIQIFRVKEGVNLNEGDPNYDLFRLAIKTSAKRLFPNFSFMDAPFNKRYYKGTPETEIAYMGCRTRVIGNVHDTEREVSNGRGNLSFTTINLPRLAIKAKGDIERFFEDLDDKVELVFEQLLERFEIQCRKHVYNYPFLMGQGVWIDSEKLEWDDEVREVLKHGTLTVGFIGLAECLKALIGEHHGESERAQNLGLQIVSYMRHKCDIKAEETKLNFSLIATPAEGLSGRFVVIDRKKFGEIPGVTDRDYYTNSFHVPVYYPITAFKKISIEAPYHELTNAGHISYIEMDGDPSQNLEAFEKIIRHMHKSGIGYGSVNHPVDRDPVCNYTGIIGDACPQCGRHEFENGPGFERIRRITGYLVGTLERFNNGKRAEEKDRVKHNI
ncbi:MAG: anaerobic ribonucleoside triphosphate reductase [Oscillospiraceae bacterium]|jgi:ribonucleoside-triphosphate reductase|nr:anaerobic ribonucleoside triphosphate reductase [Oscillospiraceae bacterium]